MIIFEQSKTGRTDDSDDYLVICDHFIAVIDGATAKSPSVTNKTSGAMVAATLAETIRTLPAQITSHDAAELFRQSVHDHVIAPHYSHVNNPDYAGDRPNASLVIFSYARREIWRIGDCHFAIGNDIYAGRRNIDEINSKLRADFNWQLLNAGTRTLSDLVTHDEGRDFILPRLTSQSLLMNNPNDPFGYGVVDGRPTPSKFIEVYKIPDSKTPITLASDGFMFLDDFLIRGMDLESALSRQRDYYLSDPLMIGDHASTKGLKHSQVWHDDITLINFDA